MERKEQIVMGTAGTMLDWVLKKKVSSIVLYLVLCAQFLENWMNLFVLHHDVHSF